MKQIFFLTIIFISFVLSISAQSVKTSSFEIELDNRKGKYETILPKSLNKIFFDQRAGGYSTKVDFKDGELFNSLLKKVKLFSISREILDITPPKKIKTKNGIIYSTGRYISHPAFYQSAVIEKKVFIFSDDELESTEIFNQLIKELKLSVKNSDEAMQVARFYLLFFTIRFRDPKQNIISSIENIPIKYRNEKLDRVEKVKDLIRPIESLKVKNDYKVIFFTWENFPRGEVNKWQFSISANGEIQLEKELLTII